ncbi:Type III secretion negative regulator (LscZ) [Vibrio splendidus]|uniref:T3SS regulon anti-activator ExsD domain-containing protein n=1 Tax=Vibrio splendidus TaxID=29497 RepID=UPI000C81EF08|nr:T3SS regulon anti-activator ExsD domain-containing protein [Vibrio splendidus]PMM76029.1 Type III secretion negative regulator (LscZ) [Vibrio splendidus]
MEKQHWRRRSLFPNNIVTQRKVTVLQRGARYEGFSQVSQEPSVVNVNYRQLLSEGVLSCDQLSLLQRLLDRNVVDCLCASQLIKTYQKFGMSLDRIAMRLFLEVGGQLSDDRVLSSFEQRLDYINHRLGYCFNLASPKTLILSMYLTLEKWGKQQTDQTVLQDSLQLERLINQLRIQKEFWLRLSGKESSVFFAEQQLELIKGQHKELCEQLSVLNDQKKQAIEYHRESFEEWKPTLEKLKGLSEYSRTSDEFFSEWEIWCGEARTKAPELIDVWDACDLVYSDLNAVAKIWQWFQDMQTVCSMDHYYVDSQNNQCGQAYNRLRQI